MQFETFIDILRYRSEQQPDSTAFIYLNHDKSPATETSLSYKELDQQARSVAAKLQSLNLATKRVLLVYPQGLEFIAAFFGCMYAGVVAVPVYPPNPRKPLDNLDNVAKDCQPSAVLMDRVAALTTQNRLAESSYLNSLPCIITDEDNYSHPDLWKEFHPKGEVLAHLQYTSGSTGTPKGVILSQNNLMHNSEIIQQSFGHTKNSVGVSWLPLYHDMGLIGNVLQPIYIGGTIVLMSPLHFIQQPLRWLKAISHYQAATSGGPNFAYDLCVRKIKPEQLDELSLNSWEVAYSGAEVVRAETIIQFQKLCERCGFRPESFYPCYGMAETTLFISGGKKTALPSIRRFEVSELERNCVLETNDYDAKTQSLVSCGMPTSDQKIVISNPETLSCCKPDEIGEIWVSSDSVAEGYWNRSKETQFSFQAHLLDTGDGPFLRTGDLGFLHKGELYITGRIKDMIIIRGRNFYPQDIEFTAEQSHPSLRPGSVAAFSLDSSNGESLVIVQELEFRQKPDFDEVIKSIQRGVSQNHDIQAHIIILIKPGTILKTSSGKVRRQACREAFITGDLQIISERINILEDIQGDCIDEMEFAKQIHLLNSSTDSIYLIQTWLISRVASRMSADTCEIDAQESISGYGLDSLDLANLIADLEELISVRISPTLRWNSSSIEELSQHIFRNIQLSKEGSSQIDADEYITVGAERDKILSLSNTQERYWFISKDNLAHISCDLRIIGLLDVDILEKCINEIIKRHESLRTTFGVDGEYPFQIIKSPFDFKLIIINLENFSKKESEKELQRIADEQEMNQFDLTCLPLMRVVLVQKSFEEHVLLLTFHHIICDAISIQNFLVEVKVLYEAFSNNRPSPLSIPVIQHADFSCWEKKFLDKENIEHLLSFWRKKIGSTLLQKNHPRTASKYCGVRQTFSLSKSLSDKLSKIGEERGVSLFNVLLTAFNLLIYRYTDDNEISVSSPCANRKGVELHKSIGFFAHSLFFQTNFSGNPTFLELLIRVTEVVYEASEHQAMPAAMLIKNLYPDQYMLPNELLQTQFNLLPTSHGSFKMENMMIIPLDTVRTKVSFSFFDLNYMASVTPTGISLMAFYNKLVFEDSFISHLSEQFQSLLKQIVDNPELHSSDFSMNSQQKYKKSYTLLSKGQTT